MGGCRFWDDITSITTYQSNERSVLFSLVVMRDKWGLEPGPPYMVMRTSISGRLSAVLYDYKEISRAQIRRRLPGCFFNLLPVSPNPLPPPPLPRPNQVQPIRHPRYLIPRPLMAPTAISQRPPKTPLRHLPTALLPALPKQIQRINRPNGNIDIRPRLPPPVQECPAARAEAARVAGRAVVVPQGCGRCCPCEEGGGGFLPHEEEVRGRAAALCALACSGLGGWGLVLACS